MQNKPMDPQVDAHDPQVAGVAEAIAELEAGLSVPLKDVEAWIDSWDTPNELPMPRPRRHSP